MFTLTDRLSSPSGRVTLNVQDDGGMVLYHDDNPVWQASDARLPSPPAPIPSPDGSIHGQLRAIGSSKFVDDRGPLLPIGCTYGWGLGQYWSDVFSARQNVAAIADAGYQFVRTWFSLGYYPYWRGHEVPPLSFVAQDGVTVAGWSNYFDTVKRYGELLAESHLQLFWSCGDLQMFRGQTAVPDIGRVEEWAYDCGRALSQSGARLCFADVNEAWQNWVTDSEPEPADIDSHVIEPLAAGYGKSFFRLRSANFAGEEKAGVDKWARDLSQVHGNRGDHPNDFVTAVRHAWNRGYEGHYLERLQIESEPGGPKIDGGSPVMGPLNDPEGLCLLAAANFLAGAAYVSHTHRGVQSWLGPLSGEHGFDAVPRVREILRPADLQASYRKMCHGAHPESPFTDNAGFPESDDRRIDTCETDDGEFVTLVYDRTGRTALRARVAVSFLCYTPDTREAHHFSLMAGEILPMEYRVGRILVGRRA